MAATKYLDYDGLLYFWTLIKTKLAEYVKHDAEALLYFNPQHSTLVDEGSSSAIVGECNVIKTGGKVVMIDVGGTNRTGSIRSYLSGIGVTKVDYLILTHYHEDHVGNVLNGNPLGLDWSGCTVYLNSAGSTLSSEYADAAARKTLCENFASTYCARTVYPSEGNTLKIGNVKITFLNCGATADAEIEAIQAEIQTAGISTQTYPLNDYSICVLMEMDGARAFYAGDIQYAAEKRLADSQAVGPVDLLKFQHHGVNSRKSLAFYIPFSSVVRAKYAVVQNGTRNDDILPYPSAEMHGWSDTSVLILPRLQPAVFACGVGGLTLASADNVARKAGSFELNAAVNPLGEGEDLDDILLPGAYTILSAANANTMLHTPMTDNAGQIANSRLVVMHGASSSYVLQMIFNQGSANVFIRRGTLSSNGVYSFSVWKQIVDSSTLQNALNLMASSSHSHGNLTNDGKLSTASRAVVTDGNKLVDVSTTTATEIGYLTGLSANAQNQINSRLLASEKITNSEIEAIMEA